jgi:hypothetical protein
MNQNIIAVLLPYQVFRILNSQIKELKEVTPLGFTAYLTVIFEGITNFVLSKLLMHGFEFRIFDNKVLSR